MNSIIGFRIGQIKITSSILQFIRYELSRTVLTGRWFLTIPIILFLSYIGTNRVMMQGSNAGKVFNTWDVLFYILGNEYHILFVLTPLFLYLVSDLVFDQGFKDSVILRVGSRKSWWLGKTVTLLLTASVYILITVGISGAISSFVLPWQNTWSDGTLQVSQVSFINREALALTPWYAFIQLNFLLLLGWISLGLLTNIMALYTGKSLIGLGTGVIMVALGIAAMKIGVSAPLSYLFVHTHLVFNFHAIDNTRSQLPSILGSIGYWGGSIIFFYIIGYWYSINRDFLAGDKES